MDTTTKTCSSCGEIKPIEAFSHKRARCKTCRVADQKNYCNENREKVLAYQKAYREANRESVSASKKRCYESNRDSYLAAQKSYNDEHREERRTYLKAHYKSNKKKYISYARAYAKANPEKVVLYRKRGYERRKEKISEKAKSARLELCDYYIKKLLIHGTDKRAADIPSELVEAKRWHLKLKRELKEKT